MSSDNRLPGLVYQRWEPATLDRVEVIKVQMPTAADLEAIHQQAHQEGYQAGFTEGAEAGRQHGAVQAAEEVRQLQALLATVTEAVGELEQAMSEDLLALSLEISKQMLRQALKIKPELLLPVIRSAMESLPQNTPHPHLHLHPEDAVLVRASMQTEAAQGGWKIIEDHRIARGGCRIETQMSETDATIENRWQRLAMALGQDTRWLDE
jgi:flagellar assembly protein FliH